MRTLIAAILAVLVGCPMAWIGTMALTPLLWKLEPVLHMELAGHSGPSDWIFLVVTSCVVVGLFLVFRAALKPRPEVTL